jgi:predicted alpha/beta hydrolase family esterase
MEKINCIIVHGSNPTEKDSKEGIPENERHWKPWLKKHLEEKGISVSNELYPEDWLPDYNKWKGVFEKNDINKRTILVGHSAGTAFILRWLSENRKKVDKIILIAPSVIKSGKYEYLSKLKDFEYDSSLKKLFNKLVIFYSDNDDKDIIESARKVHEKLDGKLINIKGKGHFTFDDMETEEFPELLKEILKR